MQIIVITNDQPVYQYLCTLSRLVVAFLIYYDDGCETDIDVCCV